MNAIDITVPEEVLGEDLIEQILARLDFSERPEPSFEALQILYAAWCQRVPFDNILKLIHVRRGSVEPFPGTSSAQFFTNWLRHGTGGTCWSGAGALHTLLHALGFRAQRGVATMLAAPNLPPNHGTVIVNFGEERYLVDASMIHGEPLPLRGEDTVIAHPARGLRCTRRDGRWSIAWRPLHQLDGFDCRLEYIGTEPGEFARRYEATRAWSPFNYELSIRANRGDTVIGAGFGKRAAIHADGTTSSEPIDHEARQRLLIEEIGISEEIVAKLPQDVPTPPPPGSRTAQVMESMS